MNSLNGQLSLSESLNVKRYETRAIRQASIYNLKQSGAACCSQCRAAAQNAGEHLKQVLMRSPGSPLEDWLSAGPTGKQRWDVRVEPEGAVDHVRS